MLTVGFGRIVLVNCLFFTCSTAGSNQSVCAGAEPHLLPHRQELSRQRLSLAHGVQTNKEPSVHRESLLQTTV